MLYIGIDTGSHTGFAVWSSELQKFLCIETLKIHQAMAEISKYGINNVKVIFEDARKRKWIPRERDFAQVKGRAMGAGSVKRDCTIWEEFLRDKGIDFEAIPPRKGLTKLSAEQFRQLTKWKRRTSEHSRDAAMLVFGK